jgi:hypothetical protein
MTTFFGPQTNVTLVKINKQSSFDSFLMSSSKYDLNSSDTNWLPLSDTSSLHIPYTANIFLNLFIIVAIVIHASELVSDNGSQFVSEEFKSYLEELGIKHTRITPYWARANGLVENFNKTLKKAIRVAPAENKNWKIFETCCSFFCQHSISFFVSALFLCFLANLVL